MGFIIILGLILLNGVLSMSEIALVSVRKVRLETEAKKGNHSAQAALNLIRQPDRFLSAIQIGITLIGILTGLYSGEAFANDFAGVINKIPFLAPYSYHIARILIVVVVTYLTLVLGELVPKKIGLNASGKVSKLVATPMLFFSKMLAPFIWLLTKSSSGVVKLLGIHPHAEARVTEEDIKAIVREGYHTGEVQEVEQDIVERVFNLGDRKVNSIMTHRSEIIWLDVMDNAEKIEEKVKHHLYNMYPVGSGRLSNLIGVVYLKDLFGKLDHRGFELKPFVRRINYIPENLSVYDALEQFKSVGVNYGIIADEFGAIEGLVTLKDIMEALIGQMPAIGDEPEMIEREDGSWLVDGQLSFYSFLEHFDMEEIYPQYDYNTLSGLILEKLEHIPVTGEQLQWLNFHLEIIDMDGARIDKVLVYKPDAK
ncbi:MAG: hemolysin family protein [Tannerellaceae bacterium]|nr:hemolysin family protein [Tannerellaceae bacterium]